MVYLQIKSKPRPYSAKANSFLWPSCSASVSSSFEIRENGVLSSVWEGDSLALPDHCPSLDKCLRPRSGQGWVSLAHISLDVFEEQLLLLCPDTESSSQNSERSQSLNVRWPLNCFVGGAVSRNLHFISLLISPSSVWQC